VQSVGIVVLAAGGSRRFGQPKQLFGWNGEPLLRSVVRSALSANADRVVVVLGAHASECAATLKDLAAAVGIQRIEIVTNESWESGMASSIRAGVENAEKAGAEAIVLLLADQPYLTTEVINRLLAEGSASSIVAARYNEVVGPPILFGSSWFEQLKNLKGDEGARQLIRGRTDSIRLIDWSEGAIDLDTEEDVEQAIAGRERLKSILRDKSSAKLIAGRAEL
jgi:molybdenum cofactor cytidylyltransferase